MIRYYSASRNLLTSVTGTQPQTFSYDALGNMSGVGGNTLTFDDASQLVQVKTPTKTINYSYDANGNRVGINDGTNNALQLYINNNLMYEVSGANQADKIDYIYLDGKLVNKVKNGVSEYLFSNLWGSPVAASSDASGGALLWTQEYAPYGKEINDLSAKREKDHIGFTGKVFDNDIGLNYMNARYYDPEIGRFISYDPAGVDPSSPLTFNRYAYAANNPYAYIDPTGMSFFGDLWGGVSHYFGEIGVAFSYGFGSGASGSSMEVNPQVNGHNISYGIGYWSGRASLSAAAIPPVAELDAGIGGVGYLVGGRESTLSKSIMTPYGYATQEISDSAILAREKVSDGALLYRAGTIGKSQTSEAQFWALDHPLSEGYASKYGIPAENINNFNFIESGVLPRGENFVTRSAPAFGDNMGGGIEVVTPENAVRLNSFHSI